MTDEQRARIAEYVTILNSNIESEGESEGQNDLLEFVIDEVVDRVLLYLNDTVLDERLERIVARVVVGVYQQTYNSRNSTEPEQAVASVSDNGQSVSYHNEVKKYLVGADDNELFGGVAKLLAPYRRVHVGPC